MHVLTLLPQGPQFWFANLSSQTLFPSSEQQHARVTEKQHVGRAPLFPLVHSAIVPPIKLQAFVKKYVQHIFAKPQKPEKVPLGELTHMHTPSFLKHG